MKYRFIEKRADTAYIAENLYLPKARFPAVAPAKAALTFVYGEETVTDDYGHALRQRPKTVELWSETEKHLIVPREFIPPRDRCKHPFPFVDINPTTFESVDLPDNIRLRNPAQEAAFHCLMQHNSGTMNLACGVGKTVLALKVAATLKVPTIVVVNSTALLEQWKEEIERFLDGPRIGVVQGPKMEWIGYPIVVAMVHSLAAKREEWPYAFRRRFGLAIFDECFPPGTLVDGKPIEKIKVGDFVTGWDEQTKKVTRQTVTRVMKTPVTSLVRVACAGRTVVCTNNHPFYSNVGWVEAQHLTTRHQVLRVTNDGKNVFAWARVDYLEVLQPGCDGTFGGLCPDGLVYNLEVSPSNTYIVETFVVHNCHHISAPLFVRAADLFYGRRVSLTATATRTDGLESIYQYHLGGVIHSNLEQDLIPTTHFHEFDWELPAQDRNQITDTFNTVNLGKVRTYLGKLAWRNERITEYALGDLASGRNILILSHSVEHAYNLYVQLSARGAGLITGETPQEDRMKILRECNPVVGTFQLAREGLNKPPLDTLYVTTPFGNSNDLQQSWGRIQRRYADKQAPLVRVFDDTAIDMCQSSNRKLRKFLKKMNYPYQIVHEH